MSAAAASRKSSSSSDSSSSEKGANQSTRGLLLSPRPNSIETSSKGYSKSTAAVSKVLSLPKRIKRFFRKGVIHKLNPPSKVNSILFLELDSAGGYVGLPKEVHHCTVRDPDIGLPLVDLPLRADRTRLSGLLGTSVRLYYTEMITFWHPTGGWAGATAILSGYALVISSPSGAIERLIPLRDIASLCVQGERIVLIGVRGFDVLITVSNIRHILQALSGMTAAGRVGLLGVTQCRSSDALVGRMDLSDVEKRIRHEAQLLQWCSEADHAPAATSLLLRDENGLETSADAAAPVEEAPVNPFLAALEREEGLELEVLALLQTPELLSTVGELPSLSAVLAQRLSEVHTVAYAAPPIVETPTLRISVPPSPPTYSPLRPVTNILEGLMPADRCESSSTSSPNNHHARHAPLPHPWPYCSRASAGSPRPFSESPFRRSPSPVSTGRQSPSTIPLFSRSDQYRGKHRDFSCSSDEVTSAASSEYLAPPPPSEFDPDPRFSSTMQSIPLNSRDYVLLCSAEAANRERLAAVWKETSALLRSVRDVGLPKRPAPSPAEAVTVSPPDPDP